MVRDEVAEEVGLRSFEAVGAAVQEPSESLLEIARSWRIDVERRQGVSAVGVDLRQRVSSDGP